MGSIRYFLTLVFLCAGCETATATEERDHGDQPATIQVMILGSYHMAGSTSDLINLEVESVLTDRRQAELEEIAEALLAFEPTMVAVERVTSPPDYFDPVYADFTDDMLRTVANERVQLGYRLASKADVTRVHGVDEQPSAEEPDYFPFDKVIAHAEATGQKTALDAYMTAAREEIENFPEETRDDHIAEKLIKINTGPLSSPDFYYGLSTFDVGEAQPAAELQAYWFMRNAKIWSKLMDGAVPGDRIVVVYGAGHKHWLEHMAAHTPGYALVDPVPYLKAAID